MRPSTDYSPIIYHDWYQKSATFNLLLTITIQRNFCTCNPAISKCHTCDKQMTKRSVIENDHTSKLNIQS